MAHDLKAFLIQLRELENKETSKIISKNVLEYNSEFDLDALDLVYRKWVEDYVNTSLPNYDPAAQKYIIRQSGVSSYSFSWQSNVPELGGAFADFYGDYPCIDMYQKSGSVFYKVEANVSFTIDASNNQADIVTVQLDNLETILIIS